MGDPQGAGPRLHPSHMLPPLGTPEREVQPVCESCLSVEELAGCPGAEKKRARGARCVYVWGWGAVLAASVLCVTLPSRGPVPSVPREPQPKSQGDGEEGGQTVLRRARQTARSPAGSCPGNWKASVASPLTPSHCRQPFCFPNALRLGTLPQNMQYMWVTGPHAHTPPRAAPGPQRLRLPQPPFCPSCLSVFTLRMASNKCCPWRPGSGSAASVSYTLGTARERPFPPAEVYRHT